MDKSQEPPQLPVSWECWCIVFLELLVHFSLIIRGAGATLLQEVDTLVSVVSERGAAPPLCTNPSRLLLAALHLGLASYTVELSPLALFLSLSLSLQAKKARHDLDVDAEVDVRESVVTSESSPSTEGDINSYPTPAGPQLNTGDREPSGNQVSEEPLDSYINTAVSSKGLPPAAGDVFAPQTYHGTKSYPHVPPQTGNPAIASFPALTQSPTYSAFPPAAQSYGLPPFGAMWPGIKTETGLAEAPSVGQTGFLSFSAPYTSAQPGQLHYSYPGQGASFTASSVYANSPAGTLVTTASVTQTHQEYSSYSPLAHSHFPQFYSPPPTYTPTSLSSSSSGGDSEGVSVAGYPSGKAEGNAETSITDSSVAVAPPAGMRERDEGGCRNSSGKAKAKARKSESTLPVDSNLERIFLWDLDETIIIFHSLLTGTFAQKFGKDQTTVLNLGLQMEELIFELADTHLFFNDLEECDQVHIEDVASDDNGQDLSNYNFAADGFSAHSGSSGQGSGGVQGGVEWMRKLAFRYRRLREIYSSFKSNVGGLLNPVKREQLLRLQADIESVTDSWMSTALKSLLLIQSRGRCVNILVTTTQLVPALAKVLLYGLGDVFPIENIYSATKIGKESCFERIVSRFGKKVTYVVIGDGRDEELAAKQHNMPFWRISTHGDLVSLHQALELDFL
ncbi:protein phosphatase EYA3 isoform X2 [Scleropages formosus]|uniref:protein phosphatase EYA3 isoform X2 n=1 Tax=Scleropages formosus TaxID=113540 RepID=UPI00087864F2|nr:eyes absent homolog 3-like isoform X2 [Scleropages formosus]